MDQQLLAILMIVRTVRIVHCNDGLWREETAIEGFAFADDLVRRLVNQGLARIAIDRPRAPNHLAVTAEGLAALQAAPLIAA